MASAELLPLEQFYAHEARHPNKTYLTQPISKGHIETLTWAEVGDQARRAAAWIRAQSFEPGSRIAIISKNCAHWIVADLAIWMAGHVSVPLYPNLTADSMRQVLEHSEARLAFIGKLDDWHLMALGVPESIIQVALPLHPQGQFAYQWSDVQRSNPIADKPVGQADQLATIIYTSGTTGMPKGVMHSFGNFAYTATRAIDLFNVTGNDRVLSYLPLCHVAERIFVEMTSLYSGLSVFFAQSLDTFVFDLRRARPTIFFAVPRIWTKFQHGVFEKMPEQRLKLLMKIPLLGGFLANKILAGMGLDAIRYAISGASPVPEALLRWYRGLGLELQEVYGMTENCGYSHVCRPGKFKLGWIGQNNPGVEVRISQDGEVQMRSGAVMQGYYKEPEKTAEVMTADGFLRTGDKGEQDAEGNLRLTGRLKEIFKTSKGKYVAPAPIENRLGENSHLEQVCVVGEGLTYPLALCVLSEIALHEEPKQLQAHLEQLLADTNSQLDRHEQLGALVLIDELWAVENGFLTPTMKIKRNVIEAAYRSFYSEWEQHKGQVFWHKVAAKANVQPEKAH